MYLKDSKTVVIKIGSSLIINEKDLIDSYNQVRDELGKYSKDLLNKEELIVLNKIDLIEKKKN